MANQNQAGNPFENEQPQLVHLEKDQSHYEYCRMQMHDIDTAHRRTFFFNLIICITVSMLAVFRIYIGGFSINGSGGHLRADLAGMDRLKTVLTFGIGQILVSMVVMVLGYLAWANFRILNIILAVWYFIVTFIGIYTLDFATGIVGAIGLVIYIFAVRENQKEAALAEMEGYPNFQENFDIQKSDIVIATLMAHKDEHRTKSTLFTTEYSLRRSKKRKAAAAAKEQAEQAGEALADTLKKHVDGIRTGSGAAETDKKEDAAKHYLTRMDTELQCIAADQDADGEEFPFRLPLKTGDRVCVCGGILSVNGVPYMPDSLNAEHHYRMRIAESGSRMRIAMSRMPETEYTEKRGPAEGPAEMPDLLTEPAADASEAVSEAVTEAAETVTETAAEAEAALTEAAAEAEETVREAAKPAEKPAQSGGQHGGKNKRKKRR